MGRYLIPLNLFENTIEYDVIIVGTGIAGLYTALSLPSSLKVALVSKSTFEENNSNLAQGGIAATLDLDGRKGHIDDTLEAGCHFNNPVAVDMMVSEGKKHIDKLCEIGVTFDRDSEGRLLVTREGGHNERRVLHVKDATGKEIIRALKEHVSGLEHITTMTETTMVDLVDCEEGICGITVLSGGSKLMMKAPSVVLATGGIGHIYPHTTNSPSVTGDGIAAAIRAGAEVRDMEMIQFHPTAFYQDQTDKRFLISEAVRGEGAILRNEAGVAFMENKHPLKDLAPRDIVARAILDEIERSSIEYVFLDVTHLDPMYIKTRFPMIYDTCLKMGIDLTKDLVPVRPVEHYFMGGIHTDLEGITSLDGLYAVGETACTGVHGANRLASNSLLEGLVFGYRAAQAIAASNRVIQGTVLAEERSHKLLDEKECMYLKGSIQDLLVHHAFIYRKASDLRNALFTIEELEKKYSEYDADTLKGIGVLNMLVCAKAIFKAAFSRKESLGSHQLLKEN
ncbi:MULTISPECIES: L-aspartate oxidase [unclassified Fusibacter]|uniref:L-aspartate oxidase n=1 Tax=unclassified Fusibacter TaxID=2624464 RepID=UPI0010119D62|nr:MULTISPECIES: L-aspartate oxidase [unclassified Fusibacter]MCK8059209.1 L-aspartate oxidase [Fusibacter sp. A2]NPE21329.1 L-aspartate oxidase [Fusibacter sp. A1]RXV62591.1 L-aspartate oxidase [Fusibacter sp. A1]